MAVPAVSYTVELRLAADEFPAGHPELEHGATGLAAKDWKAYPHGWHPPPEFSPALARAMCEDMEPTILAECRVFVCQQYRTGDRPLAWRIKDRAGKIVESGGDPPC